MPRIPFVDWPVAVVGQNAQGKSSVCRAIGALLTSNPNPLSFSSLKVYLHNDEDHGEVTLIGPQGEEWRRWTIGERSILRLPEAPPDASAHCLSLTDFINESNMARRIDTWETVLLPDRTKLREKLVERMKKLRVPEGMQRRVEKQLDDDPDWMSAWKIFHAHALDAKRAWSRVTGETFGKTKAPAWHPQDKDWSSELEGQTVEEITREHVAAQEAYRMLQTADAIDASKKLEAQAAAESAPQLKADYLAAEEELQAVQAKWDALVREREGYNAEGKARKNQIGIQQATEPKPDDATPCPYCAEPIVIDTDRKLYRREDETAFKARHARWQGKVDALQAAQVETRAKYKDVAERMKPVWGELDAAKRKREVAHTKWKVADSLAGLNDKQVKDDGYNARLVRSEQHVNRIRKHVELVTRHTDAKTAYQSFLGYDTVDNLLGSKGVRADEIRAKLQLLQEAISEVCQHSRWPLVTLDPKSFVPYVGNRPALLCSDSEKWRCQFVLQCAIAIIDKQKIVLADAADMLDWEQWGCLMKLGTWLAKEKGVSPIICATVPAEEVEDSWTTVVMDEGQSL